MAKFDTVSLASDGWKVPPFAGVVDLTERYKVQGFDYCKEYAQELCKVHLKPGYSAIFAGFIGGRMYVLADFKGLPESK